MANEVTGGDLFALWRISQVLLPRVADVYYDATRLIGPGLLPAEGPFRVNTQAHPGSAFRTSGVGAAWEELRGLIQAMTEEMGTTVLDTARGVDRAIRAYEEVDTANAGLLRDYLTDPENLNAGDTASHPPQPNADDYPGRPHPRPETP